MAVLPTVSLKRKNGSEIVDEIIHSAFNLHCSDIHIDPTTTEVIVRFRIDGQLIVYQKFQIESHQEVVGRIKSLTKLPIDEHRKTLDGRFKCVLRDQPIDIRVGITPSYYGEAVILRLLYDLQSVHTLTELGFDAEDEKLLFSKLEKSSGMILITGPTGSGKTTTLYTLIKQLRTQLISIISIEDPIEYSLAGIRQIQTNPHVGLTFANGLRSILRQDPDAIIVGEIRDTETAQIAINAALTGHLILSSLHTVDAVSSVTRLVDMHIEPYLIASTLTVVVAQRLVRKLCQNCRKDITPNHYVNSLFSKYELEKPTIIFEAKPDGCERCTKGYKDRTTIYEILEIDSTISTLIQTKRGFANRMSMANPLFASGLKKVALGLTSMSELMRFNNENLTD